MTLFTVILSRNNPIGLNICIASIRDNFPLIDHIHVLYKYTTDFYKEDYENLMRKYTEITWHMEGDDFRDSYLELINEFYNSEYLIHFYDNNVMKNKVEANELNNLMGGFGDDINYIDLKADDDLSCINGAIYRTNEFRKMANEIKFDNPKNLQDGIIHIIGKPYIISSKETKIITKKLIDNSFKIITNAYNASDYISGCIDSIKTQSYKNWKCIVVDDCSTDDTHDKIKKTVGDDPRFTVVQNKERIGMMHNMVNSSRLFGADPEDVFVILDGDDKFYDDTVLEYLNQVYQDINIWLTYGDYKTSSGDLSQNAGIVDTKKYRKWEPWCTSHLRTYRKKIWDKIRDRDLRDGSGNYFMSTPDLALMYPLVEMCGERRIKFIKRILVFYNDTSPLNEFRVNLATMEETTVYLKNKQEYEEIK